MTEPGPPAKPPRSALTMRDMIGALVVLALVVLVAGGLSRSCTFAPTGPTIDSSRLPVVDVPAELTRLASDSTFPLRVPVVPEGWRANAVDRSSLPEGGRIVSAGFLTPDGRYLRLQQGDATEEAMLRAEAGGEMAPGHGTVDVDGQQWVAYTGQRGESIWITDVGGVRMLVTGSGNEADFRALAGAAVRGEVITR
ncbi:DUF4245 domain-containing protein [Pseudonocardia sp. DSM 110487]|uniref:DUF4245 domain-containing protein n=1 Tax=Pseudonocardia sp. DSM 110487 TaxID=2865833 RepID=UPI001C6A66A6|nr:DUF4245 domain-containing protein [Pseudonocardia sp. DSM 110487]QYN36670.1 DUF4245 domain-containing protein [Pseudonocardia sp. DSM 110487]